MALKIRREKSFDRVLNSIQDNIAGAVENLFAQPVGQFVMTLTGCATIPQSICYWQQANSGAPITLTIPALKATSNVTTAMLVGLPGVLWPKTSKQVLLSVIDNGTSAIGIAAITLTGQILLFKDLAGSAFTSSGTKGVNTVDVTYNPSV